MHPNIKILKWFNFCTDFRLYAPIAIIYFSRVTGSFALGMSIFSITMLASAVFEIPTGIFSDRIGRKFTMTFGAVASALAIIFYAIGGSFMILIIGALLEGLSRAFYSGNNDALLHDTLAVDGREHDFGEQLGKVSAMFQLALAISAVFGGFIAMWSFSLVLWLSVIPQIVCVTLSLMLKYVPVREEQSGNIYSHLRGALKEFVRNPRLRDLALTDMVGFAISEGGYQFQSAFYQTLWPVWAIGIAKVISNVGATLSFHFSGWFLKRYNSFSLLIWGNLYRRVVTIAGLVFPGILSPVLLASTSFSYGITSVTKDALMQKEFGNDKRATMASLNSFGGSIVFAVFAYLLGFVADNLTPRQALLYTQLISFVMVWMYWKMFQKYEDTVYAKKT